ncbi:EF-hand domain-containing protein [Streptomyces lavendulocolor]|uniref:EF-hand domain-containing protein n=1 Tax=Streptomyces lavendulocolor TaxID=67316 RepID=UPI003C2AC2D0
MAHTSVLDTKLTQHFGLLDADGDGQFSRHDLLGLADRLGLAFAAEPAKVARLRDAYADLWDSYMQAMDSDGNGALDREEYRTGVRRAATDDPQGFADRVSEMVEAWMSICDTDNDGIITLAEFTTMYTQTLGIDAADITKAFQHLDVDGDGTLSRNEIRRAAEEFYTSDDPQARGNWLFGPLELKHA